MARRRRHEEGEGAVTGSQIGPSEEELALKGPWGSILNVGVCEAVQGTEARPPHR